MATSYSGEKIMQRQRVCQHCLSFVTHDKVGNTELSCPLCGKRAEIPNFQVKRITHHQIAAYIAGYLAAQESKDK